MFAVAPEIGNMKQSVNVLEGHTLTIPCDATGRPNPVVKWTAPRGQTFTDSNDLRPVTYDIIIIIYN